MIISRWGLLDIDRIMVVGVGQMGSGIAQVAAQAGHKVIIVDISHGSLLKEIDTMRKNLDRWLKRGKWPLPRGI